MGTLLSKQPCFGPIITLTSFALTPGVQQCLNRFLVNEAKIRRTPPNTAKGFSKEQVLDQLVEMPVYIFSTTSSLPLRLITTAYIVDNLQAGVLIETDTLAREGASLNLGRKKLSIGNMKADIVFKTPESPTGMHITVRPTMHEILRQRRLDYATFFESISCQNTTHTRRQSLFRPCTYALE